MNGATLSRLFLACSPRSKGCRPDDTRGYAIATFAETGWEPSEVEVRDATVPA